MMSVKSLAKAMGLSSDELRLQLKAVGVQVDSDEANVDKDVIGKLVRVYKDKPEPVISVFISHSHQDTELVRRLINLLRSALNLPSGQIRATSVDGFRLPGGSNTNEQLRSEVQGAKLLIGLISDSSLKSAYVTFELGARWGSGKPMIPLLTASVSPASLAGPLQDINALSCRSSAQLHQFVEEVAAHLGLPLDRPTAYQKCVDEILELNHSYGYGAVGGDVDSCGVHQHVPSLSETAKELLLKVVCDENGVVMRFRTATGLHIKTGGVDFVTDRGPRTEARWQEALNELISSGLLEDRSGKGEVFSITNTGYQKADGLTGEAPNLTNQSDG